MPTKVGTKGQVVIEQAIREELGIKPGMLAIQQVVDGSVQIAFVEIGHNRSLAGAARPFITRWPTPEERDNYDELWAEEADRFLPKHPNMRRPL